MLTLTSLEDPGPQHSWVALWTIPRHPSWGRSCEFCFGTKSTRASPVHFLIKDGHMTTLGLSGAERCNSTIYPEEERSKRLWKILTTLDTKSQALFVEANPPERGTCIHCPFICTQLQTQQLASYLWERRTCTVPRHLQLTQPKIITVAAHLPSSPASVWMAPLSTQTPKLKTQRYPQPSHIYPDTSRLTSSGFSPLLQAPIAAAQVYDLCLIWIITKSF